MSCDKGVGAALGHGSGNVLRKGSLNILRQGGGNVLRQWSGSGYATIDTASTNKQGCQVLFHILPGSVSIFCSKVASFWSANLTGRVQ